MRLSGHGIEVRVPSGWEGKVFRLSGTRATLHAANFALPPRDGSFGANAVSEMADDGVFVAVVEFSPRLAGQGLFAEQGVPGPLRARDASHRSMQRLVPGRAGIQRFFTAEGRAFCLYTVVGTKPSRDVLVGQANDLLRTIRVLPRATSGSPAPLEG
jgi:hypothetical protein